MLLTILVSLILFTVFFYGVLYSSKVQTFLISTITNYLEKELHTKVSIKKVDFEFVKTFVLEEIYVEDLQHDTLFYASKLKLDVEFSKLINKNKIGFDKVQIETMFFNLKTHKESNGTNLDFIIDYFSSNDTSASSTKFFLNINQIEIKNSKFNYRDFNYSSGGIGINFEDIGISALNVNLKDIQIVDDSISAHILNISMLEKSGFDLKHLEGVLAINGQSLKLNDSNIITTKSDLSFDVDFIYEKWTSYSRFISDVLMKFKFRQSLLNMADVAYFAPDLNGIDKQINLNGTVKGTVDNLKTKNFDLRFGNLTHLNGNFSLNGLPEINSTYFNFEIKELITNKFDIEDLPIPPFDKLNKIRLPDEMKHLGNVRFNGKISGFINDFVAFGKFNTAIGKIDSDLALKIDTIGENSSYSGSVRLYNFEVGKILNAPIVGPISLFATVDGKGFTKNTLFADLSSHIESAQINGYNYKNVDVTGHFENRLFEGRLTTEDENLKIDFEGYINLQEKVPDVQFCADIAKLNLFNLNLYKADSLSDLSSTVVLDFTGSNIDNFDGTFSAFNTNLFFNKKTYLVKDLIFESKNIGNQKILNLSSDFADLNCKGNFQFYSLGSSIATFIKNNLLQDSTGTRKKIKDPNTQIFDFNLHLKDISLLTEIFIPELKISKNQRLIGTFNNIGKEFALNGKLNEVFYNNIRFNNNNIDISFKNESLNSIIKTNKIYFSDSLGINNFSVSSQSSPLKNSTISNFINWNNNDLPRNEGNINLDFSTNQYGHYIVKLHDSNILINDTIWQFNDNNFALIDTQSVFINTLQFFSNTGYIEVNGEISKQPNKTMYATFNNFRLSTFNSIFEGLGTSISGMTNGKIEVKDVFQNPNIQANIQIERFKMSDHEFGKVLLKSEWQNEEKSLAIDAKVMIDSLRTLGLKGNYFPLRKDNHLDLNLNLNLFKLNFLNKFTEGIISDLRGNASGNINIKGDIDKPLLKGNLVLQKTSFNVDYTKTRYILQEKCNLIIEENWIGIDYATVSDMELNKAYLNGTVFHNNFSNFNLDLFLETKKIMALNTNESDNDTYFGKAYLNGTVGISGYTESLRFEINGKTEKGTVLNIPLTGSQNVEENSFVTFILKDTTQNEIIEEEIDLTGIELSFDLDVTPDTEMNIIFDPKIGDVITASGMGHLKMEISKTGNLLMFGDISITKGSYLFTLQNIINKRFSIENGSNILWTGNPYNAQIDINAIYKTRTSLNDLGIDSTKRRVPVEAVLNLKDKLLTPQITFDFRLPDVDDGTRSQFKTLIDNPEEKNRQMFALLSIGRFVAPQNNIASAANNQGKHANAGLTNSFEFISNQLSNWLSQISNEFDVNVNYQPGDKISSEEASLMISTQLFNDRLSIEGGASYYNNIQAGGNNENLLGDFNVEYKISKDGRLRLKAYQKANSAIMYNINGNPYTQGVGLFYREDFNTLKELMESYKIRKLLKLKRKQIEEEEMQYQNETRDNESKK